MSKIKWLLMFLVVSFSVMLLSPAQADQWARTYGYVGGSSEWAKSIQQTADGGYIVAGRTYVLKLDASGNVTWQKTYGSGDRDQFSSIQQTRDGGYIVAGQTSSFDSSIDAWVLKLYSDGSIEWQNAYGGEMHGAYAKSIQQTSDGGYIMAGYTGSFSSNIDAWVLKLDRYGNVLWQKAYGDGFLNNYAHSIKQTSDGGYIVAGMRMTTACGYYDGWVMKLDSSGNIQWDKTYGGADYYYDEEFYSIQQTTDGGYIVAGRNTPLGGIPPSYYDSGGYKDEYTDGLIVKLDSSGNILWAKNYGGVEGDQFSSIQQTADGGYIVAGTTSSFGAGWSDAWVMKLDASGNFRWLKTYGGASYDGAYSIQKTSDGGYIVAGYAGSWSPDRDLDMWVLKLDGNGEIRGCLDIRTYTIILASDSDISEECFCHPIVGRDTSTTPTITTTAPLSREMIDQTMCSYRSNPIIQPGPIIPPKIWITPNIGRTFQR